MAKAKRATSEGTDAARIVFWLCGECGRDNVNESREIREGGFVCYSCRAEYSADADE